jgi:hypothetical protein
VSDCVPKLSAEGTDASDAATEAAGGTQSDAAALYQCIFRASSDHVGVCLVDEPEGGAP